MKSGFAAEWMSQFYATLSEDRAIGDRLRDASLAANLGEWTSALTSVVVRTFHGLGLPTAAKGHACTVLPLNQQEYLGQDVMAFSPEETGWRFPVAVCELENATSDDRVAYSLWKVLCVRCQLRLVSAIDLSRLRERRWLCGSVRASWAPCRFLFARH
jgi:hypothetical protein